VKRVKLFRERFNCLTFLFSLLTLKLAGGEGIEPSHTGPEPVVLPLDDPPKRINYYISRFIIRQAKIDALICQNSLEKSA
jgi:hypothetical protein